MNKRVTFGGKPSAAADPESWVKDRLGTDREVVAPTAPKEPTKRLTFDIPQSLHAAVKSTCAVEGKKMNEEIIALLEARFRPNKQQQEGS